MHTISHAKLLLTATIGTGLMASLWFGIPAMDRRVNAESDTHALVAKTEMNHESSAPPANPVDMAATAPTIVATATLLSRDKPAQALLQVNGASPGWYAAGDWVASWQLEHIDENGVTFFDEAHNAHFDLALDTTSGSENSTTDNSAGGQPPFAIPDDATQVNLGDGQSITFLPGTVTTPEQEEQQLRAAQESANSEYDPGQSVTILDEVAANADEDNAFQ